MWLLVSVLVVADWVASASAQVFVLQDGAQSESESVSLREYNRRILHRAKEDSKHSFPVERVTFFDAALPASEEELKEMAGYGLLILTAISHDPDELPPSRVYLKFERQVIPLKLVALSSSQVDSGSTIGRVYGSHRMDAVFLVPIYVVPKGAEVQVDFAKNRAAFGAGWLGPMELQSSIAGATKPEPGAAPAAAALAGLMKREYPGFLAEK